MLVFGKCSTFAANKPNRMALPLEFIERTRALLGPDYAPLEAALQTEAPVSLRINRAKQTPPPAEADPVGWCESGYYLDRRLSFTFDPLFHAGAYYVQEASSMFLEQAIRQEISGPVKCLDLCAAPGGKSTHLAGLLAEGSLLVSNEVIRSRSYILAENIAKWGNPSVVVTQNDPEAFGKLTHFFDVIVADAPCSGEGMFRKDTDSTGQWSVANVELCASRQRRILGDVWEALKPGGLLIYSTCTYNTEENEENVRYIVEELGAEPVRIAVRPEWGVGGALKYDHPVYRFFPHKTRGEGFFLAVVRKAGGEVRETRFKHKPKKEKGQTAVAPPCEVQGWLQHPDRYRTAFDREGWTAFPLAHEDDYPLLAARLNILAAGIRLGEIKGREVAPAPELALSTARNPEAFPTAVLGWEDAVRYLRKETLALPATLEKGYVLVEYDRYALGFVKQLGNRANNLYPQEWRIRSGYAPEALRLFR